MKTTTIVFTLAAAVCSTAEAMTGLGFNDLSGWPTADVVTHVRLWDNGAAWNQVHLGVDVYDWSLLDQFVAQAQQVWPSVAFSYVISATPAWLADPDCMNDPANVNYAAWLGPGSNCMPTDIDEFNKFVWSVASRYPQIGAFEVWNEPQLVDFMYDYNDSGLETLSQMTKRAYNTIKSVNPGALVLSASVLPRASSGGMSKASKYLSAIQAAGWNVDLFNTHIYPMNGEGTDVWYSMLEDCKSTLASMGAPTTEVWVTETDYNLLGDVIPEDQAVNYVNGTYNYAAAAGVSNIFWYGWDEGAALQGLQLSVDSQAWYWIKKR